MSQPFPLSNAKYHFTTLALRYLDQRMKHEVPYISFEKYMQCVDCILFVTENILPVAPSMYLKASKEFILYFLGDIAGDHPFSKSQLAGFIDLYKDEGVI